MSGVGAVIGRRPLTWVAALALVLVVALAAACGGGDGIDSAVRDGPIAAVQDDHLPVVDVSVLPSRIEEIAATGVTTTRVDIFWADVAPTAPRRPADPDDPAYDWSRFDLVFRGLAEHDITPIVSAYNTPDWASDHAPPVPEAVVNGAAPRAEDFAAFMEAVATRYSGEHTPAGDSEPLPAIRHFEIWNEPNLSRFLAPQVIDGERAGLEAYAQMAIAAYPAIKRANSEAIVIVGVAGPRSSTSDTGTSAIDWIHGLQEREVPLDAYSQHIYPGVGPTIETEVVPTWATVDRLLEEIDGFEPGLPLYITEAGYTTAATAYRDTMVSEEDQSLFLEQIFALPQLATPRVPVVVQFNLQDNADWPAGLIRADGTRKPGYDTFTKIVEAQGGTRLD